MSRTVLDERQLVTNLVVVGGEQAAHNVRVAVDVLGGRVQHDVGAQVERVLPMRHTQRDFRLANTHACHIGNSLQ